MTGKDLLKLMEDKRTRNHCCIKWWREKEGIVNIQLIETAKVGDQFDDFELLDIEDMWAIVTQKCLDKVMRTIFDDDEVIVWEQVDADGAKRHLSGKFVPEVLIKVFEAETTGRYVAV
jgi:hypothetical protein